MEMHNVILFFVITFGILKYNAAQETEDQRRTARVTGLLVGFFSLLGFIAIFVAIWCYCCHYNNNKSSLKFPVRNVSVKPMVLPDKIASSPSNPQDKMDDGETPENQQTENSTVPTENKKEANGIQQEHQLEEDGTI